MRLRFRGRLALWGLLLGAIGGVLDTALLLSLGIDLRVAGRDLTAPVACYLGFSFALLGAAVGWFIDARSQAKRDARTIQQQMQALEASRRAAAQNEKLAAIGRLAAGVAHEVRNPLGVIRASASMIQESFEPASEPFQACGFICEEIDRLNTLITSLLSFARPTQPQLEPVSVERLLDRALALQHSELERRGIEVLRRLEPPLPPVTGDSALLAQVLIGLLSNAAEAVDHGGRIELRARSDAEELRLEVADSGPGIPARDAEHVFEPFFTTKASGTGLGLAMTARIVHAHGGRVESVSGRGAGLAGAGACLRVVLPARGPAAREVAA